MPAMTRTGLVALLLVAAGIAEARPTKSDAFVADVGNGVSIPIADSDYNRFADPAYKFALRAGYVFRLTDVIGIAPELGLDVIAVNTDDGTFGNTAFDWARVRAIGGARLFVYHRLGYAFARVAVGLDYSTGRFGAFGFSTSTSSTGFAFVPEIGAAFKVYKILYVGLTLGFPVGTFSFNRAVGSATTFVGADVDLLGTIQIHL
jgi:hypothetical protein